MKILIAENNPAQQQFLHGLLSELGHATLAAPDGQAAWDTLQAEPIQMVLTDWTLPVVDGSTLMNRIRAAAWPYYTYILMLITKEVRDNLVLKTEAGADDYLVKPFDRDELIARLAIGERILNLEARLKDLALHDTMTGLLSRHALYEIAQGELSRVTRTGNTASLIFMSVDHFNLVNAQYGFPAGNQVLRMMVEILAQTKRGYDSVGYGDSGEFLILLPRAEIDEASDFAERIRAKIARTQITLPDGHKVNCTVSLGVSGTSSIAGIPKLTTLLKQVKQALDFAKATGHNRVCSYTDLE